MTGGTIKLKWVALALFLIVPMALWTTEVAEPYPALLLPSGANVVRVDDGQIGYSNWLLDVQKSDGRFERIDRAQFFGPVRKSFQTYIMI